MHSLRRAETVIFVSAKEPEAAVTLDFEVRGLEMHWAGSIRAAANLLNPARHTTVILTELALPDGNWRDLVEWIRCSGSLVPIVLITSAVTAELWWDALECGIDEIMPAPLQLSNLCQFLDRHYGP